MSVNLHTHSTTNKLLLFLVVPLVFHLMKTLSFIFIPLVSALLIALLFLPFLRFLAKKNVSKSFSVVIVFGIISLFMFLLFLVLKVSVIEVLSADANFWNEIIFNINKAIEPLLKYFGITKIKGEDSINSVLHSKAVADVLSNNIGTVLNQFKQGITMFLMAVFFVILLMAGSINVQKVIENTIFKKKIPSMKTFVILEKSIVKFLIVKFFISLATGVAFSLACIFYNIPFPVFWGLMAFVLNFIQMVGSIFITFILSVFAIAQIDQTGTLVAFIFILIAIQILFGSILEPIFMGKTFSINTITILVMLMLWGYLWGIPGMVLSVPITVALKTFLEQFPKSKIIADIMS